MEEFHQMVRKSSNLAASSILSRVGIEDLAAILQSEHLRRYDPKHNGGL